MADWIYIAVNPWMPGLIKIGQSQIDAPNAKRVPELGASTGVPGNYVCKYQVAVKNYDGLEGKIHATLRKYRVNMKREHFKCSIAKAVATVRLLSEIVREEDFRSLEELAIALREEKEADATDAERVKEAVLDAYELHEKQDRLRTNYVTANPESGYPLFKKVLSLLGVLPSIFFGWMIFMDLTRVLFFSFNSFLLKEPLQFSGIVLFFAAYWWFVVRDVHVSQEQAEFLRGLAKSKYPSIDTFKDTTEIQRSALKLFWRMQSKTQEKKKAPNDEPPETENIQTVDVYTKRLEKTFEMITFSAAITFDELLELGDLSPDQQQEVLNRLLNSRRIAIDISSKGVFYKATDGHS